MSTRCLIGKENKDKTVTFIYCHHDGYVKNGVGELLFNNYNKEEDVDKLLKLGDMSSLGFKPIAAKDFECYDDEFCRPYSLRGERCPAKTVKDREKYKDYGGDQEYSYLFTEDGKWLVSAYNGEFVEVKNKL